MPYNNNEASMGIFTLFRVTVEKFESTPVLGVANCAPVAAEGTRTPSITGITSQNTRTTVQGSTIC